MNASAMTAWLRAPRTPRDQCPPTLYSTIQYNYKASMDGGYPGNNRDARPFISGMRRV